MLPERNRPLTLDPDEILARIDGTAPLIRLPVAAEKPFVEIIEGEYQGRIIFVILNLWNPNPKAVEIANRELATIVAAVNKPGAQNSEELHNIPMTVKVGIQPGQGEYGPSNRIKNYMAYAAPAQAAPIQVQTKPAPQTAGQPPINPATGLPYKPWENWPGKGQQ